jgi:ABC-2 type transport system permease protein
MGSTQTRKAGGSSLYDAVELRIREVALAVLLLVGAVWLMRRAAGKVFHLGMLMYGKEPTWAEVRRWMRET